MRARSTIFVPLLLFAACRSGSPTLGTQAAGSASAPPPLDVHAIPSAEVDAVLNPEHMPTYSGPIGTVSGIVRVSGDPAPDLPDVVSKIPAGKCEDARAFYGKLFREGPNRELGDVLVAVTNYPAFVPAPPGPKTVVTRGCAFESRTIAALFGQRIDVKNRGRETVTPALLGAKAAALMVAVPGGDPSPLFPEHVGEYRA